MQAGVAVCRAPVPALGASRPVSVRPRGGTVRRAAGWTAGTTGGRRRQQVAGNTKLHATASTGGAGGDIRDFGGRGGGGGAGGWGEGPGDGASEEGKKLKTGLWKGWEDRVAADPQFVYKVVIEQVIGVTASVLGDMSSRPYWGLYELDFVFSTLVVGSILNFSLMYLLAPTAAAASGARESLLQKLFSEQTLISWGAPGGHMFQKGFPLQKRALNFAYKGFVFALVGMSAGLVGTGMSNALLALRKKMDPEFETQNEAPGILQNASVWALHMGLSSNLRYQMLSGFDQAVSPTMSQGTFRILTSVLRGLNNVVGGMSFVMLAKLFGVQPSAGDDIKTELKAKPT